MKIGINLLLWTDFVSADHYGLLKQIKDIGYDGIEFPLGQGDLAHYEPIAKEIQQLGLDCTCITSPPPEANPVSPDAAIRNAAVDHLKSIVDITATLGSQILGGPIHSAYGSFTGAPPTADERKWCADTLNQVAEHAQTVGVTLTPEFLNRFESYFLSTAADAQALVKAVDHPNCKMMYDTHHSHIEEKNITDTVKKCANEIAHVHISESDRGTPGLGQVNWQESFSAIKSIGYDGWLTLEAFSLAIPEFASAISVWREPSPPDEVLTEGLAFIKKMWANS